MNDFLINYIQVKRVAKCQSFTISMEPIAAPLGYVV